VLKADLYLLHQARMATSGSLKGEETASGASLPQARSPSFQSELGIVHPRGLLPDPTATSGLRSLTGTKSGVLRPAGRLPSSRLPLTTHLKPSLLVLMATSGSQWI